VLLNSGGSDLFSFCGSAQVGSAPSSVIAGDFDRDGFADLAIANGGSNEVSVLPGGAQGIVRESARLEVGEEPASIQAADFTGDGSADRRPANPPSHDVGVLRGSRGGRFPPAVPADFFVGDTPTTVAAADLDGDGRVDAVTANDDGGDVSLLLGLGDGKFDLL